MDPTVIVLIVVIGTPVAVLWALARASRLRGPLFRAESRRPVEALVTRAVPDEDPDPDADPDADRDADRDPDADADPVADPDEDASDRPRVNLDSEPRERDPEPRGRAGDP